MSKKYMYRWTSFYSRDRDSKHRLKYNEFAYKKTKDDSKLEFRFQKIRPFPDCIYAKSQIKRPHITRATCTKLRALMSTGFPLDLQCMYKSKHFTKLFTGVMFLIIIQPRIPKPLLVVSNRLKI